MVMHLFFQCHYLGKENPQTFHLVSRERAPEFLECDREVARLCVRECSTEYGKAGAFMSH